MSTELEARYYDEQVPALLEVLERIAVALETQADAVAESRRLQEERIESEKNRHEAAAQERRKTIAKQLSQLGEVEKMAAELKRRMEAKRTEHLQALAAAGKEVPVATDEDAAADAAEAPPMAED